ncbi:MAG: ribonuclease G and E [Actinobacteria bacterium BACL4 MAG-120507-bin0]|jgi:ribonuclease E|uniref:Rne/Rng family ribonuclease n=1 Tax=Candidatus Nanopelagicus sp. TaxID=2518620 RepID=UPI0007131530|nr:MAG: ribonuclease G and E [Actinobacteria bacterium BACL4 MAG-121001-bin59]KRO77308.1 MAG: ribonuclease G and E [Actinobacteria bacterium BACL4 MAG-120920-bin74]KRO92454.1 MAG: ribonuclease G and E [Actinobacteria bacterium BACL4 MAG-120507-bin0]
MADEPKAPRKRAAKKAVSEEKKSTKKSPVIPVPLFQAAPVSKTPKAAKSVKAAPAVAAVESKGSDSESEEFRRRRRRGGRGRRRNGKEGAEGLDNESADLASDSESLEVTHKRRRRRRAKGEGVVPGETVEEDGVITVVKVREARVRPPRSEAKSFNRRDRNKFDRPDRRERRDFTRRRGTVITESEFLARREAVERSMLVRQIADRTQIAIIEDDVMVEHYVNRNSNISYVGNVYLGKVQNVLPSMEAAFVDIGKGRNAVLYAGEVNWDAHGLSDAAPRKIEHVLKSGQSVLVQVTKDPIGQKGARLTSQISLPGRYLVYVPGGGMSGISKRLPDNERNRLKSILKNLIPEQAGVIIRTAAEGVPEAELERDVLRLKAQWEDIEKKANSSSTSAPSLLYGEPDLTVRVIRDIFNEDFNKMLVQGDQAWDDIQNYIGHIAPELANKIEKWSSNKDLFTENRVEEQLAKAFDRKVYLPSGGSLVIDRTEAMIVIDVNTGKFIGKGGNLEETVTKNNLEAAEEIARQLRLRDMGGIIVIDFIDMTLESNRELVLRRLVECLGRDRTKHQVAEVTSLGLVQMTRKRVGQGLIEAFSTTCESCGGRGIHIHSDPVKKVALEKDMEQRFSKTSKSVSDDDEDDLDDKSETSLDTESISPDEEVEQTPPAPAARRKGRRAVSTGVISTN